ncbi:DUF4261 domain-containing protein [Stratiformator vulcanicus]|uniref:DUF4261 domain-containing protein n=1 Tax=Stratiformator vulcanicus TaxID=2527980 RepID=A0A517R085_9PLAN|nr:DUF4261 domain-containing protein [Stratiformator vulcanicus]QDT37230.1 hypothetical protein Pan189_16030 [Stratiformator vulcanicus]
MPFSNPFRRSKSADAKPSGNAAENSEDPTRHCFVLCEHAQPGDLSEADQIVAEVFGPGYSADTSEPKVISVMHGKETVGFLAHMPAPIPEGEAEENAAGNFLWPDGKEKVAQHQSHIIVTNVGGSSESAIGSALTVSRLALVALRLYDGMGVYWGNASVCNSREVFESFCEDMSEEQLPVPAWLRFQFGPASENEIGVYTLGMRQFGLMELEVDRCSMDLGELFEFVSNLAHYLILSGPVIEDGNTVGGSEEERILVRHRPSMIEKSRKVYKIVFE